MSRIIVWASKVTFRRNLGGFCFFVEFGGVGLLRFRREEVDAFSDFDFSWISGVGNWFGVGVVEGFSSFGAMLLLLLLLIVSESDSFNVGWGRRC